MELRGRNLEGVLLFSITITTAITALLGVAQLYLMISTEPRSRPESHSKGHPVCRLARGPSHGRLHWRPVSGARISARSERPTAWNEYGRTTAWSARDSPALRRRGGCGSAENRSRCSRRAIAWADAFGTGTATDGSVVSVGGTWLGKRQDRMFELCREFGLEVYPQYEQGDTVMHLDGANRRYRGIPKVDLFALASLGLAFWRLDRMVETPADR